MKRHQRPKSGDGCGPTSALAPCRCPTCGEDLVISCPKGCADADLGTTAELPPIATPRAPRDAPGRPRALQRLVDVLRVVRRFAAALAWLLLEDTRYPVSTYLLTATSKLL